MRRVWLHRVTMLSPSLPLPAVSDPRQSTMRKEFPARNVAPSELSGIDARINEKLSQLNIIPAGRSTDEAFLRRSMLDTIGTIPAPDRSFSFVPIRPVFQHRVLTNERVNCYEHWMLEAVAKSMTIKQGPSWMTSLRSIPTERLIQQVTRRTSGSSTF